MGDLAETKAIFDKDIYIEICNLIDNTENFLVMASPWIYDCEHLLDSLSEIRDKGVSIVIITRNTSKKEWDYEKRKQIFEKLRTRGITLIFNDRLHAKTVISDNKHIVISSTNLIGKSLTSNHELGILSNDEKIINDTYNYLRKIIGYNLSKELIVSGKRHNFVYSLGESKDPSAIPTLIKYTKRSDYNDRRLAASALGKLSHFRPKIFNAIPALVSLLKDPKPQIRQYAAQALGAIGVPSAISSLEELRNDEKDYVKVSARQAIYRIKNKRYQ